MNSNLITDHLNAAVSQLDSSNVQAMLSQYALKYGYDATKSEINRFLGCLEAEHTEALKQSERHA